MNECKLGDIEGCRVIIYSDVVQVIASNGHPVLTVVHDGIRDEGSLIRPFAMIAGTVWEVFDRGQED